MQPLILPNCMWSNQRLPAGVLPAMPLLDVGAVLGGYRYWHPDDSQSRGRLQLAHRLCHIHCRVAQRSLPPQP